MEKRCLILILTIFLISNIYASEITLTKEKYYPGETLQAEITGSFIDNLAVSNLGLYKNSSTHKIPMTEVGIVKDNSKYYFYAILPEIESAGEYTLKIENIRHYENNLQTSDAIIKNFRIEETNQSYISFIPGAISASKDFSIKVKAYNSEQLVNLNLLANGESESISLGAGEERTVSLSIAGITSFTRTELKVNSYSITVLISPDYVPIKNNSNSSLIKNINISELLMFNLESINATLLEDKNYSFSILIINKTNFNETINLSIESEDDRVKINDKDIMFSKGALIDLTINSDEPFTSFLIASYDNNSIFIPIYVKITANSSKVDLPSNTTRISCTDLKGSFCQSSQKCDGMLRTTYDSKSTLCCIGECKSEGSNSWVIGIVIFIIIAIIGYLFYKKSKVNPESKNLSDLFKKSTKGYETRMNPQTDLEVKKSLSKN